MKEKGQSTSLLAKYPWVQSALRSRTMPFWIAGLASLANIRVLQSGLFSDDYFHLAAIAFRLTGLPVEGHWWEIYGVPTSRGLSVPALVAKGMLPWWTSQDYSTAFLRPLAVASHYFDVVCLRARPAWMHAHNLLWYALLVLIVGQLHRRFIKSPYAAVIATLLYAIDEVHSEGVAWIAGRNTLMSACAVAGAVLAHDRWRTSGKASKAVLPAILFALGLSAGEGGISAWAYLFAYALLIEETSLITRLRSLLPYVAITLVWASLYRWGGYGAQGGAIYLDPLRQPAAFLAAFPTRFTLLWLELTTLPNTIYDLLSAEMARPIRIASYFLCATFTACFARLARLDSHSRFWLLATCLSMIPFCGVASGARLLFVPGIGATALFGILIDRFLPSLVQQHSRLRARGAQLFVLGSCVAVHLVLSVLFIPHKIRTVERQNALLHELASSLPVHGKEANQSTVFVLNTATYLFSLLTPFGRVADDRVQALYVFGAAQQACSVTRRSARVLRLDCPQGFLGEASATFVRRPKVPFQLGEGHRIGPATLRVVDLDAGGAATAVEIEVENIDDPRWVWTYWDGSANGYRRVMPPPMGTSTQLPVRSLQTRAETHVWF